VDGGSNATLININVLIDVGLRTWNLSKFCFVRKDGHLVFIAIQFYVWLSINHADSFYTRNWSINFRFHRAGQLIIVLLQCVLPLENISFSCN
jgi:hypothetical protein